MQHFETTTPSIVDTALAATNPILDKIAKHNESIVVLNVEVGKAFGKAIVPANNEPLRHDAFVNAYGDLLAQHMKSRLGHVSSNAVAVAIRVANLTAAGKAVPTRATVQKKSGADKPLSDTLYLAVLVEAQRSAGLSIAKPGSGGDNRTPEQIAEAAAKAQAAATEAAAKAATAGATVPPPATVPPQVPAKGNDPAPTSPQVPPTIDTAKAREDAAAMIMGGAKHGDLLLKAVKTRKAALIAFLESK